MKKGLKTCGSVIKEAREQKGMTINDLAFEISDKKEKEFVKEYEKKISLWESNRANPSLDEIYSLSEILGVDSGQLKILRDHPQKDFKKTEAEKEPSRIDKEGLKDTLYYVIITWGRLIVIFAIILLAIYLVRLFNMSINDISSSQEEEGKYSGNVVTNYIEGNSTNSQENVLEDVQFEDDVTYSVENDI